MCWPHCNRNVKPRINTLKKDAKNLKLGEDVLKDILNLQWAATNKDFRTLFDALEKKYVDAETPYNAVEKKAIAEFFSYFRSVWGPDSPLKNWFEAAHPFRVSSNQGIEGTNKQIEKAHFFKKRVGINKFFDIITKMIYEFSCPQMYDDSLLSKHRLTSLENNRDGLRLLTAGWQWAQQNCAGKPDRVLKVPKTSRLANYTLTESSDMGQVDQLWVVRSNSCTILGPLKDLARVLLEESGSDSQKSFDEKLKIRQSCWIIEEVQGDFFCRCPIGIKG